MTINTKRYAYCTLITQASYLAGVVVLAHTLRKHNSPYPLIVLYTDTLSAAALRVLELEAPRTNLILHPVPHLLPKGPVSLIAARFADTWTKLRVFQLYEIGPNAYDRICYLDADMSIFNNPDHVFDTPLPASESSPTTSDWIAANHACVCNLDGDVWASKEWNKENCAYTLLAGPDSSPTPVTPDSRPTHHLLNSGMFLFSPSEDLWERMLNYFNNEAPLSTYLFPDQDFLADFFRNRWVSVGWEFNAIKTMKYWHENIWRDDRVVVLHFIVDKPWTKRVSEDGTAGYLGKDGVTHGWWWSQWEDWASTRDKEVIKAIPIAKAPGATEEHERTADEVLMDAIGSAVQAMASNRAVQAVAGVLGIKVDQEATAETDRSKEEVSKAVK
jgi:inositol 3-alpha-galactosyltransferase